jgi:hypothetical protein
LPTAKLAWYGVRDTRSIILNPSAASLDPPAFATTCRQTGCPHAGEVTSLSHRSHCPARPLCKPVAPRDSKRQQTPIPRRCSWLTITLNVKAIETEIPTSSKAPHLHPTARHTGNLASRHGNDATGRRGRVFSRLHTGDRVARRCPDTCACTRGTISRTPCVFLKFAT